MGGEGGVRAGAQAKLAKAVTTPYAEGRHRKGCSMAGKEASIRWNSHHHHHH